MVSHQIRPIGVAICTPDFHITAKGFGYERSRPTSYEELAVELKAAALRKRPTFIELRDDHPYIN